MGFKLKNTSLIAAIRHLSRYGDTDVFPHLPEIAFFSDEEDNVVSELTQLDLDSYNPAGALEALAPKSKYGFRIVHQLAPLDTLLLLACVIEIGSAIEAKRQIPTGSRAFSYRFNVDEGTGGIFRQDRSYKDWLHKQKEILENRRIRKVISTDISDFYSRINFHRMENLLDEVAPKHGAVRFIKKHIKIIRAKQSFGLPVGGSAARLLAELALCDTDQALRDKGLRATRFVDDFRIFLMGENDPYDALGYLAEHLGVNEGLSLNVAKTSVASRRDYVRKLESLTTDLEEEVEGIALDAITAELYFDDDVDEADLQKLKGLNLVGMLSSEIAADNWDMGRIKVIFRALRIVKSTEAIEYINSNFATLSIFAKDLCLLMETLEIENEGCFDDLRESLLEAILGPPAASVQVIRSWLLEILVRGIVNVPISRIKQIESLPSITDRRQVLFIRGRMNDRNYFRRQKTAIQNHSEFERAPLVWGASCLPEDEYEKWVDNLKSAFDKPLGRLFLSWAQKNRSKLNSKLKPKTVDLPD